MHAYLSLSSKSTPICVGRGQQKTSRGFCYHVRGFAQPGMQLRPSLQHSSRSNSIPACRASGGVLGGLKKAFKGKNKPKRSADIVEFPPCRYVVFADSSASTGSACYSPGLTITDLSTQYVQLPALHVQCNNSCIACRLLKQTDDYELRMYDVYPFVTTPYERRDEGYLALGSYMEGRNADSAKMNLTQPIMMRYEPATVSAWQSLNSVHIILTWSECTFLLHCFQYRVFSS